MTGLGETNFSVLGDLRSFCRFYLYEELSHPSDFFYALLFLAQRRKYDWDLFESMFVRLCLAHEHVGQNRQRDETEPKVGLLLERSQPLPEAEHDLFLGVKCIEWQNLIQKGLYFLDTASLAQHDQDWLTQSYLEIGRAFYELSRLRDPGQYGLAPLKPENQDNQKIDLARLRAMLSDLLASRCWRWKGKKPGFQNLSIEKAREQRELFFKEIEDIFRRSEQIIHLHFAHIWSKFQDHRQKTLKRGDSFFFHTPSKDPDPETKAPSIKEKKLEFQLHDLQLENLISPYTGEISSHLIELELPKRLAREISDIFPPSDIFKEDDPRKQIASPTQFVLLFPTRIQALGDGRDKLTAYLDELDNRRIVHDPVLGQHFSEREEVRAVQLALRAIAYPDDVFAEYATLVGPLFGFSDLHLWRRGSETAKLDKHKELAGSDSSSETNTIFKPDELRETLSFLNLLREARNRQPPIQTMLALLHKTSALRRFFLMPHGHQAILNLEAMYQTACMLHKNQISQLKNRTEKDNLFEPNPGADPFQHWYMACEKEWRSTLPHGYDGSELSAFFNFFAALKPKHMVPVSFAYLDDHASFPRYLPEANLITILCDPATHLDTMWRDVSLRSYAKKWLQDGYLHHHFNLIRFSGKGSKNRDENGPLNGWTKGLEHSPLFECKSFRPVQSFGTLFPEQKKTETVQSQQSQNSKKTSLRLTSWLTQTKRSP